MLFLQILGVIFLILLVTAGYFAFRFWRSIKRAISGTDTDFGKLVSVLPPIFFELEKISSEDLENKHHFKQENELLAKNGFLNEGLFQADMSAVEAHISIWRHPKKHITVTLYELINHDQPDNDPIYYCDVILKTDSGAVALTSHSEDKLLPAHPNFPIVQQPGATLPELLKSMKNAIPNGASLRPVANAKQDFLDMTRTYNAWLWEEAQLLSSEMRKIYNLLKIDMNDDLLSELREFARGSENEVIQERIIKQLSKNPKISAAQWEDIRDRLVIIHEKMTAADAATSFYELFEYEDISPFENDIEQLIEQPQQLDPFQLIQTCCDQWNLALPKRIGRLSSPVKAEVYLGPAL